MKIVAVLRDRTNGEPVAGEDVVFRNPGGTEIDTVETGADGSATLTANGNPAGQVSWESSVSGETRQAGAKAQRQIGALFEAELARSFAAVVANGYGTGQGDELAVVPGTGRQVVVGTGCYWVNGVPFHFYDDTPLTSPANASLATRIDAVVIRCTFDETSTEYGKGVLTFVPGVVNNTPPTLNADEEGDYDELLALVTSANGFSSYTSGNISDQRAQAGPFAVPLDSIPAGIPQASIDGLVAALAAKAATSHTHAQSDITNLATALGAKASLSSAAFTGAVTFADGMEHNGGPWGFNGASVSGKLNDPDDVPTGTIDATWGTTEAAVLEGLRTSYNQLVELLRDCGIVGA